MIKLIAEIGINHNVDINLAKKLTPKMKKAVDDIFSTMEKKPGDFLSTFDKNVEKTAKKHGVKVKDIMSYFDKEMLTI